jgi:tRNA(adenine34) deaminase
MTSYDVAMRAALDEARDALESRDVPIGAVVLDADGSVIGRGHNVRERDGDPTGHAEMVAIRAAAGVVGGGGPGSYKKKKRPATRIMFI